MTHRQQQAEEAASQQQNSEYLRAKRMACRACSGVGFLTVWQLVTYHGKSFIVDKMEPIPEVTDNEAAQKFSRMLAERYEAHPELTRQTVLSAAKSCACRG